MTARRRCSRSTTKRKRRGGSAKKESRGAHASQSRMQSVRGTSMADSQPSLPDGMYAEWRGTVYPARGTVRPPKSVRLIVETAKEGFDEVAPGRFRRTVPMSELTALFDLQTYCT